MAQEDFSRFIDQFCQLKGLERSKAHDEALHVGVNGVPFTLLPGGTEGSVDGVVFVCDFGELPKERRELVLLRLLETNLYMFGADMPRFACNPETGHVLQMGYLPLDKVTAESVIQLLDQLSAYAQHWSESHFLLEEEQTQDDPLSSLGASQGSPMRPPRFKPS